MNLLDAESLFTRCPPRVCHRFLIVWDERGDQGHLHPLSRMQGCRGEFIRHVGCSDAGRGANEFAPTMPRNIRVERIDSKPWTQWQGGPFRHEYN